jgi:plastocyanin
MNSARTYVPAALACAALIAGCGSSSSSTTAASTPQTTSSAASGGLQPNTTPPALTPAPSSAVQSGSVNVTYKNVAIAPATLKVKVGTTITWTNADPIEHNVTSLSGPQSFQSKTLTEGSKFKIVATHAGVIHYECSFHPASMNGTIEVVS